MNKLNKITNNTTYEENIYIEDFGLLRYTLSNDLNKIQEAACLQTDIEDFSFIDKFGWKENLGLSENVKKVMKRLNVVYSMTFFIEKNTECLVINKYDNGKWYINGFERE